MIELILMKGVMLSLYCQKVTKKHPKKFVQCIKQGINFNAKKARKKIYVIIRKDT